MTQELHKKYRPASLSELVGNKESILAIKSILKKDRDKIPHAWLFCGPPGTGKTTLQRIMRDELGCSTMNYFEMNSSMVTGIDNIRNVESQANMGSLSGGSKIYAFDEAHRISKQGFDAMLKMLEDAPKNVFYFLGTTNPEMLPAAIKSRCTMIHTTLCNSKTLSTLIKKVIKKETDEEFPSDVIKAIVKASGGAPRDALKLLDFVIDMEDFDSMIACIESTIVSEGDTDTIELCRALLTYKQTTWKEVSKILRTIKGDAEGTRRMILGYCNKVLLNNGNETAFDIIRQFSENYFDTGNAGLTADCYEIFQN